MSKARGEGGRYFVVYSDPLEPLNFGGLPLAQAFDAMLKQCGYEADWGETATATLQFRHVDGPHKGLHIGIFGTVDHPREFAAEIRLGNHGMEFAREIIMAEVLRTGLNGWRGETRDNFSTTHGIAKYRKWNPDAK
jgi:hypothetical protein